MRINRIKLCNISSYSGICDLNFSVSDKKNIILIGGQNGSGKTSLFTAIKLALYGPLCFRYQSKNNQYSARIKDLISHDAFAQSDVNAFIELEIELFRDSGIVTYVIRRDWRYVNQKLSEEDCAWENGSIMSEDNFDYFQSYLYSIIPPNLFDFFFFDGEEISNVFTASGNNSYIRDAIFTLDSFDTFALIDKFCRRYVSSEADSEQYKKLYEEFDKICNILDSIEEENEKHYQKKEALNQQAIALEQEIIEIKRRFNKAGGLSKTRRSKLQKELREQEQIREQASATLKAFIENTMPLIISMPIGTQIKNQLVLEDQMQQYRTITEQMSAERLHTIASDILRDYNIEDADNFVLELSSLLTNSVKPNIDVDHFTFLHDFSHEQRNSVIGVLSELERFSQPDIVKLIEEKEHASQEGIRIRGILDASMTEDEVAHFERQVTELETKKQEVQDALDNINQEAEEFDEIVTTARSRYKNLRPTLAGLSRKINAEKYTPKISKMMQRMLSDLLKSKRIKIEDETLRLSKEILRKEHFIDRIELDNQFNFSLFREQVYTYSELASLFANIGSEELIYRLGEKGVQLLLERFNVTEIRELKNIFKDANQQATIYDNMEFFLYKRIEFQQLSKGEKQIFILSLYWAIIQSSERDIPFIIDTPYARIDMEHREQIAKKLFPDISKQVIIFSTDEEITRQYYRAIKPYISQEYTLSYSESNGKTEVRNGYFTEGV